VEAADGIALYENEGWVTSAPVEAADCMGTNDAPVEAADGIAL